jgi:hypothetical protein
MSFAPENLKAVRRYIVEKTGVPFENISIRSAKSNRGYHAGKDQIYGPYGQGDNDYSVRQTRDKAGLTNASSAIDIKLPYRGVDSPLRRLTAYLLTVAKAGGFGRSITEIIGPDATGAANYWSKATGWLPRPRLAPASHEWHIHLGFFRDTEFIDKVAIFKPFFEAPAPVTAADPDPETTTDPIPPTVEELEIVILDLQKQLDAEKVVSAGLAKVHLDDSAVLSEVVAYVDAVGTLPTATLKQKLEVYR